MTNDEAFRNKTIIGIRNRPRTSTLNTTIGSLLARFGIDYTMEHSIGPYNFDIFIPDYNLLIECHGEYWHSLPKAVRNDKSKAAYIERYHPHLRLLTIWEIEFAKEGRVLHILEKALGIRREVKAPVWKDLSVRLIPDKGDAARFVGMYHYLGSLRGGEHYGLYEGDQLIGVASFGPFQRNEQAIRYKGAVELTRFCLDPERQAKNVASWFLSRCLKLVGRVVVTYADSTHGHDGALYRACNFTFSHEVPPDYWYVDDRGWVIHKRTVWGRASSMKMTESGYAAQHGLSKKYGGAKRCFTYSLPPWRIGEPNPGPS